MTSQHPAPMDLANPKLVTDKNLYKEPADIQRIKREVSIASPRFSIKLIQSRYSDMNRVAQKRADKTLFALKTGGFFDKKKTDTTDT